MATYRSSIKTRKSLIKAAGELVSEKGFNGVSTRAIARRARQNIGSIHYHFGSKLKLFEAVVGEVARRWQAVPAEDLLVDCDLTSRQGQAEAIRLIVKRISGLLFDPSSPGWHSRVIYQLAQSPEALKEVFRQAVAIPEQEQVKKVLRSIAPDLSDEQVLIHFYVLVAPLLLHADYQQPLLLRLKKPAYDSAYLKNLVDICIRQALLYFNLIEPVNPFSIETE